MLNKERVAVDTVFCPTPIHVSKKRQNKKYIRSEERRVGKEC